MSESVLPAGSDLSTVPSEPPPRRRMPQLGLSTLLLMTACIAAWGSTWLNKQQIEQLQQRVKSLRALTRELVVQDRNLLSIVKQLPQSYQQELWHIYVPNDSLALYLATRDVPRRPGQLLSNPNRQASASFAPLTSGQHVVELKSEVDREQWTTQVLVDGAHVMNATGLERWKTPTFAQSSHFETQADLPADRPAVLFYRAFFNRDRETGTVSPTDQSRGIALWIDQSLSPPQEKR